MKIDFSEAGLRDEHTEKYSQCLEDYQEKFPPNNNEEKIISAEEYFGRMGYAYCDDAIGKEEKYKKVFRLPKVYFLPPR